MTDDKIDLAEMTGSACRSLPGPCEFASCRYNMLESGAQANSRRVQVLTFTCVLEAVEKHGTFTLNEIGEHLCVTRERIRQIESIAIRKVQRGLERLGINCEIAAPSPANWESRTGETPS
jgi:hypothetical protein